MEDASKKDLGNTQLVSGLVGSGGIVSGKVTSGAVTSVIPSGSSGIPYTTAGYFDSFGTWRPYQTYVVPSYNYVQPSISVCQCGGRVTQELIAVEDRKVKAGGDGRRKFTIVSNTRSAAVCDRCGVIAWYGPGDPPA